MFANASLPISHRNYHLVLHGENFYIGGIMISVIWNVCDYQMLIYKGCHNVIDLSLRSLVSLKSLSIDLCISSSQWFHKIWILPSNSKFPNAMTSLFNGIRLIFTGSSLDYSGNQTMQWFFLIFAETALLVTWDWSTEINRWHKWLPYGILAWERFAHYRISSQCGPQSPTVWAGVWQNFKFSGSR